MITGVVFIVVFLIDPIEAQIPDTNEGNVAYSCRIPSERWLREKLTELYIVELDKIIDGLSYLPDMQKKHEMTRRINNGFDIW